MLKKLFLAVMLLGILPGLANAWTITAKISSGAGTVTCGTQTITSGTGYFSVANTVPSTTVTATPNSGYALTQVVLDGVNITQPGVSSYTVNYNGTNHTMYVYFSVSNTYSVSLTQTPGGTTTAQLVAPTTGAISQTGLSGLSPGSTVEITASPNTGYTVNTITSTSNLGTSTVYSGSSTTPVKYRFTVDRNYTFSSSYGLTYKVTARVTADNTQGEVNNPVVIDATTSDTNDPPISYSYSVTVGDPGAVTFAPVQPGSMAAVTFQASAAGNYVVRLTATSAHGATSTADTPVLNIMAPGVYQSRECTSCHNNRDAQLCSVYLNSPHANGLTAVSCSSCHNPEATLAHPYIVKPRGTCKDCHTSFPKSVTGHQSVIGKDVCADCHDHSTEAVKFIGVQVPHYNNVTTPGYPASYVTSRSVCANCHNIEAGALHDPMRSSWAASGHAATTNLAWRGDDYKTVDGCVRCHTKSGFVAYSTGMITAAWGVASDKTKEILACDGCHNNDFTIRVLKPYSSAAAFPFRVDAANTVSVPYKNLDYAGSNVCISCHGGTTNGEIIKRAFTFANFTAAGRLLNHFMAGGGVMDNNIGYEFDGTPAGRDIDFNKQNTWHSGIGLPSAQYETGSYGPCVACHMSAPGNEHSFAAVFKNTTGIITEVAGAPTCLKCHPSQMGGGEQMTVPNLLKHKSDFDSALQVLKAELAAKGFDPDAPSQVTSWGSSPLQRANNMGAFYNYILLKRNDVAAYVHNPTYAKRLIQFSIDWIDNQLFDDSDYTSINMLNLPQQTKDAAISYLGVSFSGATPNCYSCHQTYYN